MYAFTIRKTFVPLVAKYSKSLIRIPVVDLGHGSVRRHKYLVFDIKSGVKNKRGLERSSMASQRWGGGEQIRAGICLPAALFDQLMPGFKSAQFPCLQLLLWLSK